MSLPLARAVLAAFLVFQAAPVASGSRLLDFAAEPAAAAEPAPIRIGVIDTRGRDIAFDDPLVRVHYRPFHPRSAAVPAEDGPHHGVSVLSNAAAQVRQVEPDARIELYSADIFHTDSRGVVHMSEQALRDSFRWFREAGVRVVCVAFTVPDHPAFRRIFAEARADGLLIVASLPNEAGSPHRWPAAYPGVIPVAATEAVTHPAVPTPLRADGGSHFGLQPGDAPIGGNSFATARVAGLAAWVAHRAPAMTGEGVRAELRTTLAAID